MQTVLPTHASGSNVASYVIKTGMRVTGTKGVSGAVWYPDA